MYIKYSSISTAASAVFVRLCVCVQWWCSFVWIFLEREFTHLLIGQKQSRTQVHNYIYIYMQTRGWRERRSISVVFVDRKKKKVIRRMPRVLANHYHSIDPLSTTEHAPARHNENSVHNSTPCSRSVQCKHHTAKRKFISFSGFI